MGDFFAELRKRKIWWVAGVYLAVAWIAVQVVGTLEGALTLPSWMDTATIVFLIVGFPFAIVLAWAQETQARSGVEENLDPESLAELSIEDLIKPTIAVLAFDNFTSNEDFTNLADGISEDIITSLSYNPAFVVSARNSSFQFKGTTLHVPEIGKELDVNFILEGSIRIVGDMLRVTSQLVESSTDSHIWADRIDEPLAEIGSRQDGVTANIVASTSEAIHAHILKLLSSLPEDEMPAVGLMFRAFEIQMADGESRDRRRALLMKAIEKEPDAPQFRAALNAFIAGDYSLGFSNNPERDRDEVIGQAEALLKLAPANGPVLDATGVAYSMIGKFEEGLLLSRQAFAISPDRWSRQDLANTLLRAGHVDEALEILEELTAKGIEGRGLQFELLCRALICKGDLEGALAISEKLAVHLGHVFLTWFDRAVILACLGRMDEARDCIERVRRLVPQFTYKAALASAERNYALEEHQERISRGIKLLMADDESE